MSCLHPHPSPRYTRVFPPYHSFSTHSNPLRPGPKIENFCKIEKNATFSRYFSLSARSGHHTAESLGRQLGELGESPPRYGIGGYGSYRLINAAYRNLSRSSTGSMEDESELEEDAEFVLPKMTLV